MSMMAPTNIPLRLQTPKAILTLFNNVIRKVKSQANRHGNLDRAHDFLAWRAGGPSTLISRSPAESSTEFAEASSAPSAKVISCLSAITTHCYSLAHSSPTLLARCIHDHCISLCMVNPLTGLEPVNASKMATVPMLDEENWSCPICMSLLYKPTVASSCGHIFCFWCCHKSMSPFSPSKCPLCRTSFGHFPDVGHTCNPVCAARYTIFRAIVVL